MRPQIKILLLTLRTAQARVAQVAGHLSASKGGRDAIVAKHPDDVSNTA